MEIEKNDVYSDMVSILNKGINGVSSDKIFLNEGKEHANVVLSKIFESANTKVNMLTGCMDDNVLLTDSFKKSLNSFLMKDNSELNIIFVQDITLDKDKCQLIGLTENFKSKVNLYKFKGNVSHDSQNCHFTTADDKMFRFEYDIKDFKAKCSFNRPEQVTYLNEKFEEIKVSSERVQINVG